MRGKPTWLRRFGVMVIVTLLAGLFPLGMIPAAAQPAVCTVTSSSDSDPESLRALLADTNCALIDFDLDAIGGDTITLTSGELTIARSVEIQGPGADLLTVMRDGSAPAFRIFNLTGGVSTISGLTISNGLIGGGTFDFGGGVLTAAGTTLTIANSVITGNTSGVVTTTTYAQGGGVAANGTLTITNSTISGNTATGGYWGQAGGVYGSATSNITLTTSTIDGNTAHGNTLSQGGGFWTAGAAEITRSTISGNSATGPLTYGGGFYQGGTNTITITNSTIAENSAFYGGGIYVISGTVNTDFSTVAYNTGSSGANINRAGGSFRLRNSIVAEPVTGTNCSSLISTRYYNLTDDSSCGLTGTNDQVVSDAGIETLADNYGPTETIAFDISVSPHPAIDAIPLANCSVTTDQRGFARPFNTNCDVGAFEAGYAAPSMIGIPSSIVGINADTPSGTTIDYAALVADLGITAQDYAGNSLAVTCTGPTFVATGDTATVNCESAEDALGEIATGSFQITVLSGQAQLDLLRAEVQASSIHSVAKRGLDRALASAEMGLDRNRLSTSCFQLNFFQTQVNLYRAMDQISSVQAAEWIADAANIEAALGCS